MGDGVKTARPACFARRGAAEAAPRTPMKAISLAWAVLLTSLALRLPMLADTSRVITAIQEKSSWKVLGEAGAFDASTLSGHRHQDSGIFLEYGFSELTSWHLANSQGRSLTLDLYEMIDSPAAYGVFTFLRKAANEPLSGIGNIAASGPQEVSFQQDRYYVSLRAADSMRLPRESLLELARVISQSLPNRFSMPPVAEKLPAENRVPHSEKFVMGAAALEELIPMGASDPFGLSTGAEAALAKYQSAAETATLLLVHYPTQQLARKFLDAGYAQYAARYPNQPVFYKRDGPMVVLVLASNSPELATSLLDQVSYVSMVSWDPKVEPPTIGQVMVRIFMFCGIMLAMTLVAGLLFGLIRILIKRLFPGKVFDRPKNMEVIRLNLDLKK